MMIKLIECIRMLKNEEYDGVHIIEENAIYDIEPNLKVKDK